MEKCNRAEDSTFIKNLFSGTAGQTRKSIEPADVAKPLSEAHARPGLPVTLKAGSNRQHQVSLTSMTCKSREVATNSQLSQHASEILRAARGELGRNAEQQQAAFDAVATEQEVANAIDRAIANHKGQLSDVERAELIVHLRTDLLGWGVLQPLIDDPHVTDIHVYDFRTVVCQRGKVSESTILQWPTREAYAAFIDRLLMRLGKSLSTQQHTVDGAFPDGIRLCAIHESVCVGCGPLLSIRVPRISHATLEMLVGFGLAPQFVIDYLASIARWGQATILIAGETGTGKTTLLKGLSTQFDPTESIVTAEDTPELNFNHSFLRSLVSRPANVEGVGEVTLQEHIKATLRMTPNRVILGEMRTPQAAEAFLESAQTGHTGMSTLHARNARETLVRLESLLGRAQKSVSIEITRQQIALAVDVIVWMFRDKATGRPRIGEVMEVGHFVEGSIQVKPIFKYDMTEERPTWLVESWNSYFDSVLAGDGILLGQQGGTLHLSPELELVSPQKLRSTRGGT